uniref:kunitz-type protease inhibitor 2 n=1 Tax=Scatophagus argus TaxID=75038 RepID=UPI001ED8535B|nr:kunitz-type protease inhibitor 2 [Scatophagus argus]
MVTQAGGRGRGDLTCHSGKLNCDNKKPPNTEVSSFAVAALRNFHIVELENADKVSILILGQTPVSVPDPLFTKMTCTRPGSSMVVVFFLIWSHALGCDWDQSIDPNQGVDPASLDAGLLQLDGISQASDPESCRAACCSSADCDLALVGYPMDGPPQCLLVKCWVQGRDVCVLKPSTQFKAYRKERQAQTETREGGEEHHVVPLLEQKSNETNNIRCRLPMRVGSCRAAFPRFYYDVTNQSCRSFIYGGCEDNGNNFESQQECEAFCSGVTGSVLPDESTPAPPQLPVKAVRMAPAFRTDVPQDDEDRVYSEPAATESVRAQETEMSAEDFAERCEAGPDAGPCRAAFKHWYYNKETRDCQSFIFGGCKGNKNNYVSKESCMAACTVTVLPSFKKDTPDDDVSKEYKDQCLVKPDPGPCRAAFQMFYFDPSTDTCQTFIYGGCRGNNNRYSSVEECKSRCTAQGFFDTRGKTRNRWTPALFLFTTLAVISALMLATLIVITLRRRGLSRRPSSVSDKQELLPDPEEQLSVESLTIPESPKPDKA